MAKSSRNKNIVSRKKESFKFYLHDEVLWKTFESAFEDSKGDWAKIKSQLTKNKNFSPAIIKDLEFTHTLLTWSDDDAKVVSLFQNDPDINSSRDIALKFNKDSLLEKLKDTAPQESQEANDKFAKKMYARLFNLEPTAVLINMVRDPKIPLLDNSIGKSVTAVLEKHPEFNIKTTSIHKIIDNEEMFNDISVDSIPLVKNELKTLQRITAVSPVPDAVPVLHNTGITTAFQISEMPATQFVKLMKDKGLDPSTVKQVHDNAQAIRVRNEQAIISLKETSQGTGIAMIDKSLNAQQTNPDVIDQTNEKLAENNLSWNLLFGDADFCECGECTSVYSAASYYVELLQYLRNNNLDIHAEGTIKINPNPRDISGTPLEKLFNRRPDLGCLELTCSNTNTILPYVDLVNEVMENYLAFTELKPFNVGDETSSELLAEPQHTEYKAYQILKKVVYPFTLPYHQPIDETRIYLKYLETSRHELIDTFRKDNSNIDATLATLKDDALDRAVDSESLNLTKEEYIILTKQSFESKRLMNKVHNKVHTTAEYQEIIGVKPVHKYYGYKNKSTMLGNKGLTLIKKEFLRRTGVDYFSLVDLLLTQFINPCLPNGKSRVIMESLRFSYRFLQLHAKAHGIDKMAEDLVLAEKFADILPALVEEVKSLRGKGNDKLECPNPSEAKPEITDEELIRWVKYNFKKIGKIIVIESGRGCVNGEIIYRRGKNSKLFIKDCIIVFSKDGKDESPVGSVDKNTGKVTWGDGQTEFNPEDLNGFEFIGEKGERGVFMVIDGEAYLIFLDQKDSCDLDTALLQHLDGTPLSVKEYDRIHRFIRLWRKLGWTIDETDKAIIALSVKESGAAHFSSISSPLVLSPIEQGIKLKNFDKDITCATLDYDINPMLLHQLVAVNKLLEKTGIELIKLLSFWGKISTAGNNALYKRLFLKHNILGIDTVFQADANGNYLNGNEKISDHKPAVMASLNLTSDDIDIIINAGITSNKLTLSNLSTLYRYRLLSKVIGLKIPDFIAVLPLFGSIFKDAYTTLIFLENWLKMEESGFTANQLNYIIRNIDHVKKPFAPSFFETLKLAKIIYDGLNSIDENHPNLKAEESINDPLLQLQDIWDKASSTFIRTKASLLFDTTTAESIIGFLEGTTVYTTNAPANLSIILGDDNSLKKKLLYNGTAGAIQITGILTSDEKADFISLSADANWLAALTRIEKQQNKLFKQLLSGVFENEKTKSAADKLALENTIKSGDVIIPLDQLADGVEDPNTAQRKRVAFLEIYLPYVRQQLTHRFVVNTLANFARLDNKTTEVLISEIVKTGVPLTPIYGVFENIKESAKPLESDWDGYLIPSSESTYTFIIKNTDVPPVISINNAPIIFTAQEDPTNEWWSASLPLVGGTLYKFHAIGTDLKNIFWKTASSAITAIPPSALIPDFASKLCEPALVALKKTAMLVDTFNLSPEELLFFKENSTAFESIDFNAITFTHWQRLEAYVRLRNSLPGTDFNILDFWKWSYDPLSDGNQLSEKISELTNWKKESIDKLITINHLNINTIDAYRNELNLLKIQHALSVADKIGMDIDLLFDWAVPTSNFNTCREIAESIRNSMRAKYLQSDWEQVVKPLKDELRNNQKNALIAYLLQRPELILWGVTDSNGLFEYFLIDVEMDACMETSRIKQAISSVQLFVQRCMLGLEEMHSGIASDVLDRDRWEWMQRYRVWEANRKVFLYPENWIESNLRDDKSPFFKELESELLQKDINNQNVTDALKSYLYKVDEAANMEVVGLFVEGEKNGYQWNGNSKLHVFSRTRNAPYFFYYRYLSLDEMNWYPWEKVQVDIPSYDVTDPDNKTFVTGNGCYLTPVVWNNRLIIFFPQIMKKTRPNPNAPSGSLAALADDPDGITKSTPKDYYEIKMGWSEYRNKKWTQKQLSKKSLSIDVKTGRNIDQFTFIPDVTSTSIVIRVEDMDHYSLPKYTFKGFTFSGSIFNDDNDMEEPGIYIPSSINSEFGGETHFQNVDGKIQSMQLANNSWGNDNATFIVGRNSVVFDYPNASIYSESFYLVNSQNLMDKISRDNLKELFDYGHGMSLENFGPFDQDNASDTPDICHELKQPYSIYNWELFFHTPMMLAEALSKSQQFEEAMKWYHFVFDPLAKGNEEDRFWQFRPFEELKSKGILNSIFNNLKPNQTDQTISEWRDKPFMPHVVARSRPVAYMKWVVMKYLDNLVAWGDYLFRQDTIESINQATQLYVLAWHILGNRPMMIPKRGKVKPQTYINLLDKWDAFGNAVVELELAAPFSNQTEFPYGAVNGELAFANIFGLSSTLYFCLPNNPKLMGYWDTIDDRLYKIRHCENIEGVFRKLPLFDPPIDPALLVKAAAQGLSISSVLNDLSTPLPNYRFYYLLQKALELCSELKAIGNSLLTAIEKKDNEALGLIRAKHESSMQNLLMEIKKKNLEDAQKNLEGLLQNRKSPEHRMKYYLKLIGENSDKVPGVDSEFAELANSIENPINESGLKLIKYEKQEMDKAAEAADLQDDIGKIESLASMLHAIPTIGAFATPIGVGANFTIGGSNFGSATQGIARWMQTDAAEHSFDSSQAGKKGGFLRALQERTFQANSAGYELKQIDKQITSQMIRIELANMEISNQQKAIDNANEVEEFLKNKYTNEELYTWMRGNLKTLYYQVYGLAYELAKKAEKVFRFERGLSSSNYIQAGYWDTGRDGLLSGEQLFVGLKQLEAAYQNEPGYDYEITKHISLRQINPLALLELREKGKCEFSFPEVLFDIDFPGHYKRRVKSVSISVPSVAGPYTGVNATFRLLENKFRNTAVAGKTYDESTEETDERFSKYIIPIQAIATSTGQNDSGLFELNFKDERYLPFEGAGVISKWRLELSEIRQFDYNTISDIIVHVRYTSCEGGERLKRSALESVKKFIKANEDLARNQGLFTVIDLKHDLSTEWHKGTTVPDAEGRYTIDLSKAPKFIPYYLATELNTLKATDVILATDLNENGYILNDEAFGPAAKIGSLETRVLADQSLSLDNWKLTVTENSRNAKQMFMVIRMII